MRNTYLGFLIFWGTLYQSSFAQVVVNADTTKTDACSQFSDTMGKVASTLLTVGQDRVNKINAVLKVKDLWLLKQKLNCMPYKNLDQPAYSSRSALLTRLDIEKWDALNAAQRIRLVCHQLAVLADYERDGEFFISQDIESILKRNSFSTLALSFYAKAVVEGPDNTYTLQEPFIMVGNKGYDVAISRSEDLEVLDRSNYIGPGICKFMGLSAYVTAIRKHIDEHDQSSYALFNRDGIFTGVSRITERENPAKIEAITCR